MRAFQKNGGDTYKVVGLICKEVPETYLKCRSESYAKCSWTVIEYCVVMPMGSFIPMAPQIVSRQSKIQSDKVVAAFLASLSGTRRL